MKQGDEFSWIIFLAYLALFGSSRESDTEVWVFDNLYSSFSYSASCGDGERGLGTRQQQIEYLIYSSIDSSEFGEQPPSL